ncbi:hypothetical protein [Candidatus Pelagibacter communis]|uniref:hypothetical protein n=1 Tax=Pelagibacter ubique TaxID=198252 RepID=UPI00094C6D9B|nr:hypothetical protein [Candidatus Pelagibacter ubique]
MKKQILTIIMCLLFYSCGFSPVYKDKKFSNFSISSIEFIGEKNINNIIKTNLFRYKDRTSEVNYRLKINTSYSKKILAKDANGNPTNYEFGVSVNLKTFKITNIGDEEAIELNYSEKNNIKNEDNKINQKNYEKQIINNLASTISRKIAFDLSNLYDN